MWIYTSTPPYAFMALVLNYLGTGTTLPFTFYFYSRKGYSYNKVVLDRGTGKRRKTGGWGAMETVSSGPRKFHF
jgi:hypothetical protein